MAITVYPSSNYNSFISLNDATAYFGTRLYSDKFLSASEPIKGAALTTAFRSINELDLAIDPTEAHHIKALKEAQCEQALHELRKDLDSQNARSFIPIDIKLTNNRELPRYSQRAMAILRPYLSMPSVQIVR
ncbi:MAG: hypothetical protein C4518_08585 [Desulfobacteraceae bacterium]|nr:MAG: hypothetical protein C4518_08585 [Desulfobacteraceae bacterium]